jgi:hypothetical protein
MNINHSENYLNIKLHFVFTIKYKKRLLSGKLNDNQIEII